MSVCEKAKRKVKNNKVNGKPVTPVLMWTTWGRHWWKESPEKLKVKEFAGSSPGALAHHG